MCVHICACGEASLWLHLSFTLVTSAIHESVGAVRCARDAAGVPPRAPTNVAVTVEVLPCAYSGRDAKNAAVSVISLLYDVSSVH
jgi:hypothetical protein